MRPNTAARERVAAMVSEVLAPWVLAAVLPVVVGGVSDRQPWRGLALGALVAGSVVVLAVVLGPWTWVLLPAVVAVAWSRLVLSAHTPAQVLGGAVVGAAIAEGVMTVL